MKSVQNIGKGDVETWRCWWRRERERPVRGNKESAGLRIPAWPAPLICSGRLWCSQGREYKGLIKRQDMHSWVLEILVNHFGGKWKMSQRTQEISLTKGVTGMPLQKELGSRSTRTLLWGLWMITKLRLPEIRYCACVFCAGPYVYLPGKMCGWITGNFSKVRKSR